jgi:hypothetical protein
MVALVKALGEIAKAINRLATIQRDAAVLHCGLEIANLFRAHGTPSDVEEALRRLANKLSQSEIDVS